VEVTEEALAAVFAVLSPHLDERQRRLLAGAQARALGAAESRWSLARRVWPVPRSASGPTRSTKALR